jgi:transcriptional regulator with XRE-family HTH domain
MAGRSGAAGRGRQVVAPVLRNPPQAAGDIICDVVTAAELVRHVRRRHGISQRALALRAGTTQARVSAIERGRTQPGVETLRRLLLVMGEDLVLDSRPLPSLAEHDPIAESHARAQTPSERIADALQWMNLDVRRSP